MKQLRLCYIKEEYVDYLRQFDDKVSYNKLKTRPYVVLYFNIMIFVILLLSPVQNQNTKI